MNNFSFKNVLNITKFDLKNNKKLLMGWGISLFAVMFLYMVLFPSIKDIAQVKIDLMPKEILQFVGLNEMTDMGNYIAYYGMILNIIMIVISVFAVTFTAGLIQKEEKQKTIEFLNSLELTRTEIYVSKLVTAFLAVLLMVMLITLSALICGYIGGGDTFILMDFITITKITSFSAFYFLSVSMLFSGISGKFNASAIASLVVVVSYLMGYLGNLLEEKAEWLKYLSPFELFNPKNALALNNETIYALLIYFGIMIIFVICGNISYKKRDFNI